MYIHFYTVSCRTFRFICQIVSFALYYCTCLCYIHYVILLYQIPVYFIQCHFVFSCCAKSYLSCCALSYLLCCAISYILPFYAVPIVPFNSLSHRACISAFLILQCDIHTFLYCVIFYLYMRCYSTLLCSPVPYALYLSILYYIDSFILCHICCTFFMVRYIIYFNALSYRTFMLHRSYDAVLYCLMSYFLCCVIV